MNEGRVMSKADSGGYIGVKGTVDVRQPDRVFISDMLSILKKECEQLHESVVELRSRLAPVMADQVAEALAPRPTPQVASKVSAVVLEIFSETVEVHRLVEATLRTLDL